MYPVNRKNVKAAFALSGSSMREFAAKHGVSHALVSYVVTGERNNKAILADLQKLVNKQFDKQFRSNKAA